jgi:hypothetical protein
MAHSSSSKKSEMEDSDSDSENIKGTILLAVRVHRE